MAKIRKHRTEKLFIHENLPDPEIPALRNKAEKISEETGENPEYIKTQWALKASERIEEILRDCQSQYIIDRDEQIKRINLEYPDFSKSDNLLRWSPLFGIIQFRYNGVLKTLVY